MYPKVILIGGADVDARIKLAKDLMGEFDIIVLGSSSALQSKFLASGIDYFAYHLCRTIDPIADLLTIKQLITILRTLNPQIVHTFGTKPNVWGRLAAKAAKVPIVIGTVTGLGSLYDEKNNTQIVRFVYQVLQKFACSMSDLTIFQNHDDAAQFTKTGIVSENKVKTILGSGVDTLKFSPSNISQRQKNDIRETFGFRNDEMVVTMISRVIRSKGVLEFATAAQQLTQQYRNIRFLLVGPDDQSSLDRLNEAELLQLKRTVTWTGYRQDISAILAISDVFVLPSAYREGIPRVLLEAASMGLPLITTDSPGCNEIVKNGINGYLIPIKDTNALIQSIIKLIEQPNMRQCFGEASRERAIRYFDQTIVAEQIRTTYFELLGQENCKVPPIVKTADR